MKKLRECKNFSELYEAVGEANFGNVAYVLMILLILAPTVCGIINYYMLKASFNFITPYDAYEYNYKCMTIYSIIFMLMILWTSMYFAGKLSYNKSQIKEVCMMLKKDYNWLLWWLILLVWTIIPVIFSVDPQGAFLGISQLAGGYISHIYMFGVMGCAFLLSRNGRGEEIVWAFISVMDILAVIMIAFEYDLIFIGRFSAAPGVSVYTNSNHFGYMLTMGCVAVAAMYYKLILSDKDEAYWGKIVFCIVSLVILSFSIIINDTLGSYLAIVFAFLLVPLIMWIKTKKKRIALSVPMIILIVFTILSYYGVFPTKLGSTIGRSLVVFWADLFKVGRKSEGYRQAGTDRIGLWIDTIKRISERPILGYGPDITVDRNNNYILWNTPHNEFLECAFFLGIPGLILYLGGLISLCITKCNSIKRLTMVELIAAGVVIGYLASSFFGVRKFNTVCYFFMFIGILAGGGKRKCADEK